MIPSHTDGREPNTIIRTHKSTEDKSSKVGPKRDLAVTDVPFDELSVVVGELLPKGHKEDAFEGKINSAKYSTRFDPSVHDFVDMAPATGIIVKQINHTRYSLYPLHSRQDWEKFQKATFNGGICTFTKQYMDDQQDQSGDTPTANTWNVPDDMLQALAPRDAIISYIHLALSLWEDGGETGHLEQVYSAIMNCLGRPNWAEVEGTDAEGHLKLLQIMITGQDGFDMRARGKRGWAEVEGTDPMPKATRSCSR
ncbi:hypothetical protein NCS52_00076600 [Fusarium sp. LHS14.1]|nr:hypothetical protein NCS52_00076600 [Fusarium sp. LHS14.1]